MFRTALVRTAKFVSQRTVSTSIASRSIALHSIRYNSTQTPKPSLTAQQIKKDALKRQDDMQRDWDARVLTYAELVPKTENPTPDSYLIDVREPEETMQGMIPSAVNIPLSVLPGALHMSPETFKEKFGFEKPKPDQEVTFYCRSGMRSTTASDVAKRNGYTDILNYKGSWLEWTDKQNKKGST
ncbi:hypothetical protein K443DRAFT_677701 [Laccaria amethystina LaAM-08-1]|uniref:Rhodanese domain-containing protein n=1 Tax=Laccaria amethystina LaAM-08-1 TaxID=1095629 RepID=A0A0C9WTF5_9AGAR|nr:hypothetical protein K443DRAFT_677701 [Laccaria amethystina LaAM-08-1]